MEIFKIILSIHIALGTLGLLAGTYITLAKKGDKQHKLIGKVFAISMLGVGVSSFALAIMHRNDFLFAVGVFTFYSAGTGWRYLYLRNIADGQKAKRIDWFLMLFMLVASIVFIVMGIQAVASKSYFGIVLILFAWRGISAIVSDYKTYKGHLNTKNYWLTFHLQRMMGAYVASLTAFVVVNAPERVSIIPWVLPAIFFVPLIVKWSRKYKVELDI